VQRVIFAPVPSALLPAIVHWWQVSWVAWFEVVGALATLAGLYLTWRQAKKAKEEASDAGLQAREAKVAAEAASSAIDRTQRQLRANQMLVLIPQLRWLAQELDTAIAAGDSAMTRRHLDGWRWQAGHVSGLLLDAKAERRILRALQESVALATEATNSLLKNQRPVLDSCEQARQSIGAACNLLTIFIGQNASQATPDQTGVSK
jgi:hypothetical protein